MAFEAFKEGVSASKQMDMDSPDATASVASANLAHEPKTPLATLAASLPGSEVPVTTAATAEPSPAILEDHATLEHPTEPAQILWVSGQPEPFVLSVPMLYANIERFRPLLDLDRGSVVPLDMLKDAHDESKKYFQTQPEIPVHLSKNSFDSSQEALEQMRAEKDAHSKASQDLKKEKKSLVDEGARAYQGNIPGNGFLSQILKAFQEGLLEGYLAAHKTKESLASVAESTVATLAHTARGVAKVKAISTEGVATMASLLRKGPKPTVSAIKLDIQKLVAETVRPLGASTPSPDAPEQSEYTRLFSNGVKNAKSTVNVEFIAMAKHGKGAVLRFTDETGKDIGADLAAATGKEFKTGGVFGKGAVYLEGKNALEGKTSGDTEKNIVEKLVMPAVAKMKLAYPTAITLGQGNTIEKAAIVLGQSSSPVIAKPDKVPEKTTPPVAKKNKERER